MSFLLLGASHMPRKCATTLPFLKKDIPMLSFCFGCCGGSGLQDGLEMKNNCLGSLESNVDAEGISQWTRLNSSCE